MILIKKPYLFICFACFGFFLPDICFAQTTPIAITKISDMDFGVGFLGDPSKRIANVNSETAENASFLVTGERRTTFTTTLPNFIFMTHSSSGDRIRVRRFRSRPRNGRIRNTGERMIFVSATRNAIGTGISTGSYSGTFTVDVVY